MVEVFITDVKQPEEAVRVLLVLTEQFPLTRINFDLEDCDRILKVEGNNIVREKIIELIILNGHQCDVLN